MLSFDYNRPTERNKFSQGKNYFKSVHEGNRGILRQGDASFIIFMRQACPPLSKVKRPYRAFRQLSFGGKQKFDIAVCLQS